jgi:hypothetical protein
MTLYQKDIRSSANPHAAGNLSAALRVPTHTIKFVLIKVTQSIIFWAFYERNHSASTGDASYKQQFIWQYKQ